MIASGSAEIFLKEMKNDSEEAPQLLELCMLLAKTYEKAGSASSILATMEETFDATTSPSSCRSVAATIYFRLNDRVNALKCLRHAGRDIEQLALQCQIHISSNRLDLANRTWDSMRKTNDDHTLTTLFRSVINLYEGGSKIQESSYMLDSLLQKFGRGDSALLRNLRAVCELHLGRSSSSDEDEDSKLSSTNRYLRNLLRFDVSKDSTVVSQERQEVEAMFDKALAGRK
jgi:hypothetical protein